MTNYLTSLGVPMTNKPVYYGDRICKKCGKEIPYGMKECQCKPVVNEKLMLILLSVVNECENCSMMGERQMCQASTKEEMREKCAKQAHDQITELFREDNKNLLEACKMAKTQLLNCAYAFDMPQRFKESFNKGQKQLEQVITEAEKKIGGER